MPANEVFALIFSAFLVCTALFFMPVKDHLGSSIRNSLQALEDSLDEKERKEYNAS